MAGLTLALVCVAASGLLVVIQRQALCMSDRGPAINQQPNQMQN